MSGQMVAEILLTQSKDALNPIGNHHVDEFGRHFMYGRANGALTAGWFCIMSTDDNYDFTPMTTTLVETAGTNWKSLGVACCDVTDDYYAWFWIGYGTFECIIEDSFAAGDVVYTTAAAGIAGADNTSFQLDGFKTIDAGVTATRVTCFAANRLTAGITEASD
jgi:hypothetical protein